MLAAAARELEKEFERVASDPARSVLEKRRDLARLLRRMFEEAISDIKEGAAHAHMRGDFVLDFVERADLAPAMLHRCFAVCASDNENANVTVLLEIAAKQKAELERYMPPLVLRWHGPDA